MGVSIARGLIGGIGIVLLVCGLLVVAAAGPGGTLFALLFLIVPGALMVVAALIERLRYRSLASEGIGESPRPRGRRVRRAGPPIPPVRRAVRRPDDGPQDARLRRSADRRPAVRRGALGAVTRVTGTPHERGVSEGASERRRGILGGPTGIGSLVSSRPRPGPVRSLRGP